MSEQTKIEWADSTFNPWTGCTKVSPACDHCYAESWSKRAGPNVGKWGPGAPRVLTSAAYWRQLLQWNAMNVRVVDGVPMLWRGDTSYVNEPPHAIHVTPLTDPKGRFLKVKSIDISPEKWEAAKPWRRRVFCASLADWLDNEVPIEWLVGLLDLIRLTPNLDWLLLTKRIGNWRSRILAAISAYAGISQELATWLGEWLDGNPPANVWLGATVCNQAEADRDIPKLLAVPARVRFLSIEPMLGPVNIGKWLDPWTCGDCMFHGSEDDCGPDGCQECGADEAFAGGADFCTKCGANDNAAQPSCPNCGSHRSYSRDCGFMFDSDAHLLNWVICGGESGPGARPMHPDWARSLRDQCAAAGVSFFLKQMGGVRDKLGNLNDLPVDLRVREVPHAVS